MNIYKKRYYKPSEINSAKKSLVPDGFAQPQKPKDIKKSLLGFNPVVSQAKGAATPNLIHRVLSKMAFGSTPELVAHIQSLAGADETQKFYAYIDEQLSPNAIDDTDVDAKLTPAHGYETLNKTRQEFYQQHSVRPDGMEIEWAYHVLPGTETSFATFLRASQSKKQLFEVMTDFWHNHFNVYMDSDGIPPMFVHYDRDVIRPDALGSFRNMLENVTKATCMLDYLGNAYNHKDAPNENFAREILELHTISAKNYLGHTPAIDVPVVDGRKVGYVEEDVVEMARALTGWSYSGADYDEIMNGTATGEFVYRDDWHDKGTKTVMGKSYDFDAANPEKDMKDILDDLAEHPATAEFLAIKLCTRFISDNPTQAIIDAVKTSLHTNWQSPNQIKLAMEVLLKSSEFLNTWGEKIKRPFERVVSAMRQLGYSYDFDPNNNNSDWLFWSFYNSGQIPFYWTSPNGYPDKKSAWLSSSSIMSTWRFMQLISRIEQQQFDNNGDPILDGNDDPIYVPFNTIVAQTQAHFTNANDITANNLVDYWFQRACGVLPNAHIKEKLTDFMSYENYTAPVVLDKDTPIDLTTNQWIGGYVHNRLTAVVTTIFLTSEFNYR